MELVRGSPSSAAMTPLRHANGPLETVAKDSHNHIATGQRGYAHPDGQPISCNSNPYGVVVFDSGVLSHDIAYHSGVGSHFKPYYFNVPLEEWRSFSDPVTNIANEASYNWFFTIFFHGEVVGNTEVKDIARIRGGGWVTVKYRDSL